MEELKGTIFNIQRYSLDDGPGIRTTVFFKGCPLRCLWCSNPESQNPWPEIMYRESVCRKCGTCERTCPEQAITVDENGAHIDRDKCTVCQKCIEACPAEALRISGQVMTINEVYKVATRDKDFYEDSNGGVTASGGEILTQVEFVTALFKKLQDNGIHTCADTSGFGDSVALKQLLAYTRLVSFDVKLIDPEKHQAYIGYNNDLILKNLKIVLESGTPTVIRV
ncbi:MAG: glycyl-radical enzyme activating protein, partial [Peptococcaceae bacterium]|nr:glycyl-radical enzyme activating protein [Peptococcaceae bacterium]